MIEGLSARLSRYYNEKIDILRDPEWKIEILPQKKEAWRGLAYVKERNPEVWHSELIPVKDYEGSAQRSEEDLGQEHTKSPLLKKLPRAKVGGSKKYGKEKPLPWRQALVPESLEESLDFERGSDPKKSMNIGKHRKFKIGEKIQVYNSLYDDYWDAIVSDIWDQEDGYTMTAEIPEIEGHYAIIFNEDFGEWMIDK
jgi:hypothetical protein